MQQWALKVCHRGQSAYCLPQPVLWKAVQSSTLPGHQPRRDPWVMARLSLPALGGGLPRAGERAAFTSVFQPRARHILAAHEFVGNWPGPPSNHHTAAAATARRDSGRENKEESHPESLPYAKLGAKV